MRYSAILLGVLAFGVFFVGTACAGEPPYKTIEEAVLASGGTYGVIDTSNPDAANNFVDAVFDKGLTNSDDQGASLYLRPGVQFTQRVNEYLAYCYYKGKKGEKIRIIVDRIDFDAELYLLDANGAFLGSEKNYDGNPQASLEAKLPYTGEYSIQIQCKGAKEGLFKIRLESDIAEVVADERRDNLVAGGTYTVRDLKQNQANRTPEFILDAYCVFKKTNECRCNPDPNMRCKPCGPRFNVGLADDPRPRSGYEEFEVDDAVLIDSIHDTEVFTRFKVGEKYRLKVRVENLSRTSVPSNFIRFLALEE